MTTYTVKAGETNFKPLESPWPIFRTRGFRVRGHFLPGGWCGLDDYEGDKDWYDWQKLKGVTHFLSSNNRRSAMFAFRFGSEPGTYEIAAYTNSKEYDKGWFASGSIIVRENEEFILECNLRPRRAIYSASTATDSGFKVEHRLKRPSTSREIGTYAGGANNSPGPYGGKALKDMSVRLEFDILK